MVKQLEECITTKHERFISETLILKRGLKVSASIILLA